MYILLDHMIAKAVIPNKKLYITIDTLITKQNKISAPRLIISEKTYSSPHFPNFPPKNTPPDVNYLRKIYLNYLSKTNLA